MTPTTSVLQNILSRVLTSAEFRSIVDQINLGSRVISISGLVIGAARALVLAALQRETGRPFALVVQANRDLEAWERDVRFWYCALHGWSNCDETVLILPSSESDPYAGASPHAETLEQRALTLWRLARPPSGTAR